MLHGGRSDWHSVMQLSAVMSPKSENVEYRIQKKVKCVFPWSLISTGDHSRKYISTTLLLSPSEELPPAILILMKQLWIVWSCYGNLGHCAHYLKLHPQIPETTVVQVLNSTSMLLDVVFRLQQNRTNGYFQTYAITAEKGLVNIARAGWSAPTHGSRLRRWETLTVTKN